MACPICGGDGNVGAVRPAPDGREGHYVDCQRCGPYFITEEAFKDLPGELRGDADRVARVAHGVRRMQRAGAPPLLTTEVISNLVAMALPSVFEQADNLIRWIGETTHPGEQAQLDAHKHLFVIGAKTPTAFEFVVNHLIATGYIKGPQAMGGHAHQELTFMGWDYLDKLQRGAIESRKAFMAMRYGDAALDRVVNEFFRPAVAQAGFTLTRLDDQPRAGLIDDRLRVEIRNSRFLIADLTHDNLGAYWEAGYAEGLGKPVIYTCERKKFEGAKTHFDTNHHLTVVWGADNPGVAAEQLKATIRATLPGEAKLTDE